jgi:hypothetical protein
MKQKRAARGIDPGSRLVEEKHARLVHDRGPEARCFHPPGELLVADCLARRRPAKSRTQRFQPSRRSGHAIDAGEVRFSSTLRSS